MGPRHGKDLESSCVWAGSAEGAPGRGDGVSHPSTRTARPGAQASRHSARTDVHGHWAESESHRLIPSGIWGGRRADLGTSVDPRLQQKEEHVVSG